MTDPNTHETELGRLRETIVDLVDPERTEVDADALERASRRRALGAVRARARRPERNRFRGRGFRTLAAASAFALAALVAIAVAPGGRDDGGDGGSRGVSSITPSASAAEVLDQAGATFVREAEPVGTGPVWHSVARSYVDGELTSVTEQWFDPEGDTYLAAAWGEERLSDSKQQVLQVTGVDAAGTSRLRTYEAPIGTGDWRLPDDEYLTLHHVQELPAGSGVRQRGLSRAVQEWLDVFGSNPTDAELVAATRRFGGLTKNDFFGGQSPEFSRALMYPDRTAEEQMDPEFQQAVQDEIEAGKDALRIRPMLYLLTTVQSTPEATRALYQQIGQFDFLTRMPDTKVDGRAAVRIRYDQVDMGRHRERVLVVDAETGAPIRFESVDGKSWTEIEPARRVESLADDSVLCDEAVVPCDLLLGRGPIAEQWAPIVAGERVKRDAEFMRDETNMFQLARPLRPDDPDDSVYGVFTGECARDARMLSVCRG